MSNAMEEKMRNEELRNLTYRIVQARSKIIDTAEAVNNSLVRPASPKRL
jgi:hypothetical protein